MEILKFFGFQGTCYKPNEYSRLENDDSGTKFLLKYNQNLKDLNDFSQYDSIYAKFEKLVDEYKSSFKFDDSIFKRTINTDLIEPKKTIFKQKLKKRSAFNANITVINEEDETEKTEMVKLNKKEIDDHFFFKSDEILTGNIKMLKNQRVLTKQTSVDIPDSGLVVKKEQPPKKKHRPSDSFVADQTTQFVDAESTIQISTVKSTKKKQQRSKLAGNLNKTKKKKSKSDHIKENIAQVNSTSIFQPVETELKNKTVKFIKDSDVNPFNQLKSFTGDTNIVKTVLDDNDKKLLKTVEKKLSSKGKIDGLKTFFENVEKKIKERRKLKEKDAIKEKIPRVSDPKSLKKRKSRLSVAKQQKTKKKSINGVKAFINDNIISKEKLQKFNEIKNSIIHKQAKTPCLKSVQKSQKLDLLASKCVTLKKMNASCLPAVTNKKPAKDFIKLNKLNMTANRKVDLSINKSINQSCLFYQAKNEQTKNVYIYKGMNDYAVDKLVTQKAALKQRQGSTSTISSYSSLDSNCSVNDQTFKSAYSKLPGMNSTLSSIMTNDKTSFHKTTNSTINRVNLNATAQSKVVKKNNSMNKSTVAISNKIIEKKSQVENKNLLTVPELSYKNSIKKTDIPAVPTNKITKPKLVDYNIEDLNSEDETDDEEEPSKPIPEWANFSLVTKKVVAQNRGYINFTKLFKGSSDDQIDLSNIFSIQRNRFNARTSSAHWECPPIWQTDGIKGNESFRNR